MILRGLQGWKETFDSPHRSPWVCKKWEKNKEMCLSFKRKIKATRESGGMIKKTGAYLTGFKVLVPDWWNYWTSSKHLSALVIYRGVLPCVQQIRGTNQEKIQFKGNFESQGIRNMKQMQTSDIIGNILDIAPDDHFRISVDLWTFRMRNPNQKSDVNFKQQSL